MENRTIAKNVGDNVRRLRLAREWGLAQLSAYLTDVGHPMSVPVISKMELGERGVDVDDLVGLARALAVPPAQLLVEPTVAGREKIAAVLALLEEAEFEAGGALLRHREAEDAWKGAQMRVAEALVAVRSAVAELSDADKAGMKKHLSLKYHPNSKEIRAIFPTKQEGQS